MPEGQYMARVIDAAGLVASESEISSCGGTQVIRLEKRPQAPAERATSDRISVRQLQHPPSKDAIKSFHEAQKYSDARQYEKAVAALEKAIHLSPDFAEAHSNPGALYVRLHRFEKGREEAQRAMEIAFPNVRDLVNCALADWALNRMTEALRLVNQALHLDHGSVAAHFIAGSLLIMSTDTVAEGIHHLEIAAEKLPAAAQQLAKACQVLAGK